MNHCSQAPQIRETRAAAERYLESWAERGMDWDAWMEEVEGARSAFAALIGADADEVGITTSVSQSASAFASALRFDGQRTVVVSSDTEFPTVQHVWGAQERRGANIHWTPIVNGAPSTDHYVEAMDERTCVVSVPHGYYQTGAVQDLRPLVARAREVGALVFVDAYQTLGTRPLDVRTVEVDALTSGCLKYLMGVPGLAFLYVRREVAQTLEPTLTGWFGRREPFAFTKALDWGVGARRFDSGTPPVFESYVCRAGLEVIRRVGPSAIRSWTQILSARVQDGGREMGLEVEGPGDPSRRTPVTAFRVADSPEVERRLRADGVIASARGSSIRIAPHYYNSVDDVDRVLEALARATRGLHP